MVDSSETQGPRSSVLTPPAVRGAAEYVKKHYIDPNLAALSGRSYRRPGQRTAGASNLSGAFLPPETPGRVTEPLRGKGVRLTVSPGSVSIAFSGLDAVADGQAVRGCQRVADDIEVLVDTFLAKAKTTSLYFIFSTEEPGVQRTSPPPPRRSGRRR